MHHNFLALPLQSFPLILNRGFQLSLIITACLPLSGCLVYRPEDPSTREAVTVNTNKKLSRAIADGTHFEQGLQPPVLKSSDLKSVEQMLLQRDRATPPQKKLALEFITDGKRLAADATATGLNNERSGLSKLFCDSAIEYPTVEGLMGCAEAIALADVSLDVRIKQFGKAASIYRTIPAFARAIDAPLSSQETQTVEDNIRCLESFIWSLDTEVTDCQIITNALQ